MIIFLKHWLCWIGVLWLVVLLYFIIIDLPNWRRWNEHGYSSIINEPDAGFLLFGLHLVAFFLALLSYVFYWAALGTKNLLF